MKLTPSRKCPHFRQNRCRMRRPPPRKRQPKSTAGTRQPRTEGDQHRRVDEREIPDFRLMALRPLSDHLERQYLPGLVNWPRESVQLRIARLSVPWL